MLLDSSSTCSAVVEIPLDEFVELGVSLSLHSSYFQCPFISPGQIPDGGTSCPSTLSNTWTLTHRTPTSVLTLASVQSISQGTSPVLPLNNIQGSTPGPFWDMQLMPLGGILSSSSRAAPLRGVIPGSLSVMPPQGILPSSLRVVPFEGIVSGSSENMPLNGDLNNFCNPTFPLTNIQIENSLGSAVTYCQITSLTLSISHPPVICQYSTADIFLVSDLAAQKVYATVYHLSSIFFSLLELLLKILFFNKEFMLMWISSSAKSRNTIQLVQLSMCRHLYFQHDFIVVIKNVMRKNISLYIKAQIMLCAHPCLPLFLIIVKSLLRKIKKTRRL